VGIDKRAAWPFTEIVNSGRPHTRPKEGETMRAGWWLVVLLMLGGMFQMQRPADRGVDSNETVEAMDGGSGEPPPPR
jgi:hypothetical protein